MLIFCGLALKDSSEAGMAENHVAGKVAMGQLRKVSLIDVSGGGLSSRLQEAGIWLVTRNSLPRVLSCHLCTSEGCASSQMSELPPMKI